MDSPKLNLREYKILLCWLKARRGVICYTAALFGFFFLVYGLHGYKWGTAGYAALLSFVLGVIMAIRDFTRFYARHQRLSLQTGRFPLERLEEPKNLIEQGYYNIAMALEAERYRLSDLFEREIYDAGEYYTLWAHQIKTPIAAMDLLVQSPRSEIPDDLKDELERDLINIRQYADMALQYQRLSSFNNDLVPGRHDLSSLVRKAAKNCAALFIYKGLALDIEKVSGHITTDEKWFCFVLEQLLTNAVKYTSVGKIKVYSLETGKLIIEDSGIGIPAGDLPRVFERGFTGAAGRTERSSTGIGLYLCRRVLLKLGFGISIESEPGKGTKVILDIRQEEALTD